MKNQKGSVVVWVLILIVILIIIGGIYFYSKNTSTISPTIQTSAATSTSNDQLSTFSSPLFGVTFQYDPQGMGVDLEGNTAYIYFLQAKNPYGGDYIKVFNKDSSDSLSDAIKKVVFSGSLPPHSGIGLNTHSGFSIEGSNVVTASLNCSVVELGVSVCTSYADSGSPGFFFEDTARPQYFYFVSIGSAFGGVPGTISWIGTLRAVPSIETNSTSTDVSVPGMSKYTDSSFGFSFWYPSSWTVSQVAITNSQFSGGTITKSLRASSASGSGFQVDEVNFPSQSVTTPDAGCTGTYFFSATSTQWMETTSHCDGGQTTAYDTSNNTMGGLSVFSTQNGISSISYIIPLGATSVAKALIVSNTGQYPNSPVPAVSSIVSTDQSTVPISAAQQTQTIQAEAKAYGVSSQ